MDSIDGTPIGAVLDRLDTAVDDLLDLRPDPTALTTAQTLNILQRIETIARRLPVPGHPLITELAAHAVPAEIDGSLIQTLIDRLRITRSDARRRIRDAAELTERRSLIGEPLPPAHPEVAQAQRDGAIGPDHIRAIHRFNRRLPACIADSIRAESEARLVELAREFDPDRLNSLADHIVDHLNPDGTFNDAERTLKRSLIIGRQQADGMTKIVGYLKPELRAALEAVLAKLAAPGMANPADSEPTVDGTPSPEAIDRDTRSTAQRNHDALHTALRALLASGKLGQHNGLPVSIVITTTLAELEAGAGRGLTAGGTLLPISEIARLAGHAHQYLAVFEKGKPLALYHSKRIANKAQRLVLYASERGCSFPGCTVSAYYCEVHHTTAWARTHHTHITELGLACPSSHHPLIEPGGWQTRKNARYQTEWIPPPHLDHGQPRVNHHHHPERLIRRGEDDRDAPHRGGGNTGHTDGEQDEGP